MNEGRDKVRRSANESEMASANATAPSCVLGVCITANGSMLPSEDGLDGLDSEILIGMTWSRLLGHPVDAVALAVDPAVLSDLVQASLLRRAVREVARECPVLWITPTVADRAAEAFRLKPGMDDEARKAAGAAQAVLDAPG